MTLLPHIHTIHSHEFTTFIYKLLFGGCLKVIFGYYGKFLRLFPSQIVSKSFLEKPVTVLMTLASSDSTVSEYAFTFLTTDGFKGNLLLFPDGRSHLHSVVRTSPV